MTSQEGDSVFRSLTKRIFGCSNNAKVVNSPRKRKCSKHPDAQIRAITGRGLGVAVRNGRKIHAGETILSEEPLVSLNLTAEGDLIGKRDEMSGEFKSMELDEELLSLTDEELTTFYSLADAFR